MSLWGCTQAGPDRTVLREHRYALAEGGSTTWDELRGDRATVVITLDPECPFCQAYAPVIDSLARRYEAHGVRFAGLYAGAFLHADEARSFARTSHFTFPQLMDPDCALATALDARVTPECFLLDEEDRLRYRGALDDRAVRAGRHRLIARHHFLADALEHLLARTDPRAQEVTPVGCIVECGSP